MQRKTEVRWAILYVDSGGEDRSLPLNGTGPAIDSLGNPSRTRLPKRDGQDDRSQADKFCSGGGEIVGDRQVGRTS